MYIKTGALVLLAAVALSAYLGYGFADNRCKLEFAEYRNKAESEYAALLSERIESAQTYSERVHELETKHAADLQKQRTEYDTAIADLQHDFKPDGVLAGADRTKGGDSARPTADSSRGTVCYTKTELRDKIAKSLAIAAECDKLATDYAALLNLIEVYNDAKKRPVD